MALPAFSFLTVFFAMPLMLVVVFSFATRNRFGGTDLSGWNTDSYRELGSDLVRQVLVRSIVLAAVTTFICLLLAYPFAYYMATRKMGIRNLMLVFVMIPFWTNFLVRNYAWYVIWGPTGRSAGSLRPSGSDQPVSCSLKPRWF